MHLYFSIVFPCWGLFPYGFIKIKKKDVILLIALAFIEKKRAFLLIVKVFSISGKNKEESNTKDGLYAGE